MAEARAKKRTPRFSTSWLPKYGLRVTSRDADGSQEVTSLSCRFCEVFGRTGRIDSDGGARKRKRTTRVMVFTPPWRTEHMRTHMVEQHGTHYAQYSALGLAEKDAFFAAPALSPPPPPPSIVPPTATAGIAAVKLGDPQIGSPSPSSDGDLIISAASASAEPVGLDSVVAPPLPSSVTPVSAITPVLTLDTPQPSQPPNVGGSVAPTATMLTATTTTAAASVEQQQLHASVEAYYSSIRQMQRQRPTNEAHRLVSERILVAGVPPGVTQLLEKLPQVVSSFASCGFPVPFGIRGLHVLVLGCASGRDAFVASELVGLAGSVTAVEHDEDQLQIAREHIGSSSAQLGFAYPNARFVNGYSECLELAGVPEKSVDLVIANGTLSASPFKEKVLEQAYRALRTGGELCLCDVFASRRLPDAARTHELLRGERLGGALYAEDFKRLCRQTGFGEPRRLHAVPIDMSRNAQASALVGATRFHGVTFRCFKAANMESGPDEEDYGQIATYKGSIAEYPFAYTLDDAHTFETNRPVRVGGNTAAILLESWLSRHFIVAGDRSLHFGQFDERTVCGRRPATEPIW